MTSVDADAALMVRNDATEKELLPTVFGLLEDEERQKVMKDNIAKFAKPNAADDIVDQIEIILKLNK
mgnify:FL=1